MALLNDGIISTPEDLRNYESAILATANTEGIDLGVKLELAQREISSNLLRFFTDMTAQGTAPPTVGLNQVVATEALYFWHVMHTLSLVFRDAYHSYLNDRYKAKRDAYKLEAENAAERLYGIGVGLVNIPVARAALPDIGRTNGSLAAGVYEIRVAWLNSAGKEGAPSDWSYFETSDGSIPVVAAGSAPVNGVSWNVYAGPRNGPLTRQNTTPLAPGATWTAPANGFTTSGAPLGTGQSPDTYMRQTNRRA